VTPQTSISATGRSTSVEGGSGQTRPEGPMTVVFRYASDEFRV